MGDKVKKCGKEELALPVPVSEKEENWREASKREIDYNLSVPLPSPCLPPFPPGPAGTRRLSERGPDVGGGNLCSINGHRRKTGRYVDRSGGAEKGRKKKI